MARVQPGLLVAVLGACLLTSAPRVLAQGGSGKVPAPEEVEPAAEGPELLGDEQAIEEELVPREDFRETTDPHEDPKKRYMFLGAGWRMIQMPPWLLKAYTVESGPAIGSTSSLFAELAFRRNGFQVTANAGFIKWDFRGPFQLAGDVIEDTEWLSARLKIFALSSAVTWSTSFTDWFQIEYGFEAGLGFVFGDVTRSEAVRRNGRWRPCETWASTTDDESDLTRFNPRADNPPSREEVRYCDIPVGPEDAPPPASNPSDEDGAHYGVKAKRGLFNGGIPNVVPILGPRASLRFKPIHQLVIRVDVPLPVFPFGFMGGLSAQYGF